MVPIKIANIDYSRRLKELLQKEEVKAYTMAILSFFAISFFTIFAIKPALKTFFALQKQIKDYEELDKQLEEKINSLLAAQEQYQTYKDQAYLLKEALPDDPQFTMMIKKMETLTEEEKTPLDKLEMKDLNFIKNTKNTSQSKTDNQDYSIYNFSFSVNGLFPNTEAFLKRLLNQKRIIAFENVKMKKEKEEDQNINMEVGAVTYFSKK